MLGRRQIREKVVEALYSYYQNPVSHDVLEKNMITEIGKIYHLYIYEINFLVALKDLAQQQMDIAKKKYFRTASEENPNEKFIENQVLLQLENNNERIEFTAKHKELSWDLHDELLVKTFQKIVAGKRYNDYMNDPERSFDTDQKFIGKLFLKYVAENDDFHARMEEKEMSWSDDLHITNSMLQKTIGFMKEGQQQHTLIKMLKDEEDEKFARRLLRLCLTNWEVSEQKLKEKLQNWEIERVSLMDKIILVAAITELDQFPATPSRIIINEYIEIAKAFATDKSHIFVNGILDKYTKELNRI